jgi:hypothetical protein
MRKAAPLSVLPILLLLSSPVPAADTSRTLKLELSAAESAHFRVENLAGTIKVVPGAGTKVMAVATLHAESDKVAGLMGFEKVPGESGVPTLRVIYPLADYETIRFESPRHSGGALSGLFGGSNTTTKYAGHRVKLSSTEGVRLKADLEIQVPTGKSLEAYFRNDVGRLDAGGLDGKLTFDSSGGEISLDHLKGQVKADTGSGDVKASNLSGAFTCDTGSGNCDLNGFEGDKLAFDVGSGDISVKSATASRISADTGSGDILVTGSDVERFDADTGSGDVTFESGGDRLVKVTADTGSGDVTLRLSPGATFEAMADQGSGDIRMGFKDAEPILQRKQVIGYRRGDSRIHIDVNTGSGDLSIEPLR